MNGIVLGSPLEAGPSRPPRHTGSWLPLPHIHTGFVVHPSTPAGVSATVSSKSPKSPNFRNRFSWSGVPPAGQPNGGLAAGRGNIYELALDVGDEFFAFEEYKCAIEEDGKGDTWYRGFVVPPKTLSDISPDLRSIPPYLPPKVETQVIIGIFPASITHIRPGTVNDDGTLSAAFEDALREAESRYTRGVAANGMNQSGRLGEVTEEDEDRVDDGSVKSPKPDTIPDVVDVVSSPKMLPIPAGGMSRPNRPKSLLLDARIAPAHPTKPQPPVPTITAGDSTAAGQAWPLVDEIACAIREWHERLPTYLANREYRLFDIVMQHIDCLFSGRRQILAQTHSEEELARVRRECVSRLVKCNVAQGLDVIVRSLHDGSVMVTDPERATSGANWISGITCYVYQIQLAYIDLIPLDTLFGRQSSLIPSTKTLAAPEPPRAFSLSASKAELVHPERSGSFHHLFLDVKAFIASPCASEETAELYFSLYNSVETRFVTEEYCLILNHLGTPARDSEQRLGKLRTLFTDLQAGDLASSVYIVCRIVRNGAMRMKADTLSPIDELGRRASNTRGSRGNLLSDFGTMRRTSSTYDSNATDDSFSITSAFGANAVQSMDTINSASTCIVEGRPSFRRPFGCAILELPQLQKLLKESEARDVGVEFSMPIYVPKEEASFARMHEDIILGRTKNYIKSNKAQSIAICLKAMEGVYSQLVREHPATLLEVPRTARLGFPDVVFPDVVRNDIYIKLWSASFVPFTATTGSVRGRKSLATGNQGDVQVSMEVRKADGTTIPDAIRAGGSGEPAMSTFQSIVFHHTDQPTFGEMLKISLDRKLTDCHVFLSFRSRGRDRPATLDPHELEKPFAFAYMPLMTTSTCVKDGVHDLVLYRMEKNLHPSPKLYYNAPHTSTEDPQLTSDVSKNMTALRDRVTLRSYLCSSMHTADDTLRTLLLNRQELVADLGKLSETLQLFNFVSEEEIAKFVPATLDALFGFMVSNLGDRQDEVDDSVFLAVVKVLTMTTDRRFPNFDKVLDIYITEKFTFPASSFRLLRAMKSTMAKPSTKEYRSFIKVWHLIFRFIIRARALDRAKGIGLDATSAHIEADFKRQTTAILTEIDNLMKSDDKTLIGTQTLAVQHYADVLPSLSQVFPPLEIADIIISFADTLALSKGSIAIHKLFLLLQVVRSTFDTAEARALLVPAMIRWVRPHLGRYEEEGQMKIENQKTRDAARIKWLECSRIAATVVAWMVNKLQEWLLSPLIEDEARAQEEDNLEYCLTLLPILVATYHDLNDPRTLTLLNRHRSNEALWRETPDVFPMSYPFALMAQLPPPSLLERQKQADEDGLPPQSELFKCSMAETAVVILSLVLASPSSNIGRWLSEILDIEGVQACSRLLVSIFSFSKSIIRHEAFPKTWLTLSLMAHGSIVKLLGAVAEIMEKEAFIPPVKTADTFNVVLWTECFELLCDLTGSEALALEEHTHQKRRAGWVIAGDLRDEAVALLVRLWNAVGWPIDESNAGADGPRYGGYQTRFTGLAGRVLGLCMSGHDETCRSAVEILFSMIYAEYILDGKFDVIETEVLTKLDRLFSNRSATASEPAARAWFVTELRQVFETGPAIDDKFHSKVAIFLDEIELFIALLENVRELPDTPEWADERAAATYQMLDFIRRIGRDGLYVRFVHQLKDIFIREKNWLSAGMTLKLHAELYEWQADGDLLDRCTEGDLALPAQTPFARKEAIYRHCLEYFAEAQAYEQAIEMANELCSQHRKITWDAGKISELLAYQAKLWDQIRTSRRQKPEYYRVAFYGDFRPALCQGKEYIIRGEPWQQFSDFCDTLQHKYPEASLHRSKMQPAPPLRAGVDQIIWVTSVIPEPDLTLPMFGDGVHENVQSYHRYNGIKTFSTLRPYKVHSPTSVDEDDSTGVMTWLEKTTLITRDIFPTVLGRSEVVETKYEHLSPINAAINEVKEAIRRLSVHCSRSRSPDVKQLGTAINGAVDSPVQGGVKLYRQTFLSPTYEIKHPEEKDQIDLLRAQILEYASIIDRALDIHGQVCRDTAFHEALKSHYLRAFPDEIALLSHSNQRQSGPLPPLNLDPDQTIFASPSSPRPSDVSSRAPITVTTPYSLPPLRLGPSSNTSAKILPTIPTISTPVTSPDRPKRTASILNSSPARAKSPISSPKRPAANPMATLGSRLSFSGTNKSSDTIGLGPSDVGSVSGSVRKKGNRLSRLGDFMRRGQP